MLIYCIWDVAGLKSEIEKKELRKKAEEYLNRAEKLKKIVKSQEGLCGMYMDSQCVPHVIAP